MLQKVYNIIYITYIRNTNIDYTFLLPSPLTPPPMEENFHLPFPLTPPPWEENFNLPSPLTPPPMEENFHLPSTLIPPKGRRIKYYFPLPGEGGKSS